MNTYEQLGRIVAARTFFDRIIDARAFFGRILTNRIFFGDAMESTDLDSTEVLSKVIRILIDDIDDSAAGLQADEILDDLVCDLVAMIEDKKA